MGSKTLWREPIAKLFGARHQNRTWRFGEARERSDIKHIQASLSGIMWTARRRWLFFFHFGVETLADPVPRAPGASPSNMWSDGEPAERT